MLAVVLATLAKLVVILKLGLRSISKKITNLIFLNINILPEHDLTHIILFVLKSFSSHPFTIASVPLAPSCLCLLFFSFFYFCISLSSIVFIIATLIIGTFYCLSYTLLLLHLFIPHLVIDFITTM